MTADPITGTRAARRLQRIRGGGIDNRTSYGRRFRRTARGALGRFLESHEYGFQDGACLILAMAVQRWSRRALALHAAFDTDPSRPMAQHVVAGDGTLFLDSDGLATAADLEAKLDCFERWRRPRPRHVVRPVDLGPLTAPIPTDPTAVRWLARWIEARMGAFPPHGLTGVLSEDEAR